MTWTLPWRRAAMWYFTQACSITLTAPIEISQDTILNAQGYSVTINGGGIGPIFQVDSGITFSNIGLTISGGANTNGGAYYILDGRLRHSHQLHGDEQQRRRPSPGSTELTASAVSRAMAATARTARAGWPGLGGAIYNLGNLALLNCVLTNNSAIGGAGGQGGAGGAGYAARRLQRRQRRQRRRGRGRLRRGRLYRRPGHDPGQQLHFCRQHSHRRRWAGKAAPAAPALSRAWLAAAAPAPQPPAAASTATRTRP